MEPKETHRSKQSSPSQTIGQTSSSQKLGQSLSSSTPEQEKKTINSRRFRSVFGQKTFTTMSLTEQVQQKNEQLRKELQSDYQSITTEHPEFKRLGKFESPREVEMIRHFVDKGIYPPSEICSDILQIRKEAQRNRDRDHKNGYDRTFSDSKTIEKAIASSLSDFDIFGEARFEELDKNGEPIHDDPGVILDARQSLEFDDRHNHADIICTIQNPDTGQQPIIFAIDATFNMRELQRKLFENGKSGFRGEGGTGIQGFTRLKYYEGNDEGSPYRPKTKSGMRERATGLVPLFVVGFSHELAATLGDEDVPHYKREQASNHAAPIIIKELLTQTEANIKALEADIAANGSLGPSDRQSIALRKLKTLKKYFNNAWQSCLNNDERCKHTAAWEKDEFANRIVNAVGHSSESRAA